MMTTVTFVVSVAVAIAIGTCGAYWLMLKLLGTRSGKQAVKDYAKDLTDLTYDILKENMKDTKRWTELMTEGVED